MDFTKITNKQVKFLQSLKLKKYRQKYNKYTIEGIKLVKELLVDVPDYLDYCIVSDAFAKEHQHFLENTDVSILVANGKQMEMMSSMKNSTGIMALGSMHTDFSLGAFAQKGRYLFLEHAQDPGNMGTMIRTAAWFGLDGVLIGEGSTEIWNQKVIQSSMGAIFKIKHKVISFEELSQASIPIIVTSLQGESLHAFTWPSDFILCLGNEGKGITNGLLSRADHNVFIESSNNKGAESLNVASSASILLYQAQVSSTT